MVAHAQADRGHVQRLAQGAGPHEGGGPRPQGVGGCAPVPEGPQGPCGDEGVEGWRVAFPVDRGLRRRQRRRA